MQKYGLNAVLPPLADGELLPKRWRLGDSHPKSRCKDLIIGDVRVEAIIFDSLSRHLPQALFHKKALDAFPSTADAALMYEYFGFAALEEKEQPQEGYRNALRFFISTVLFHFPSLRIAESFQGKAHLYHFEEPSPYAGPSHGLPVHGQCAVFVYGAERDKWPESAQKVSKEMAEKWTAFAHGEEPWEPYSAAERLMRFGPDGDCGMTTLEDDDMRDYTYLGWLRDHFEEAVALVQSLMM